MLIATGKRQTRELAHRRDLVRRIFHRRITLSLPVLHQMDTEHHRQRVRQTTTGLALKRLDPFLQPTPSNDLVYLGQELLLPRLLALGAVLRTRNSSPDPWPVIPFPGWATVAESEAILESAQTSAIRYGRLLTIPLLPGESTMAHARARG